MLANDGRVVSNFIVQSLQGKPITIYGDGQQTRSFCYVEDTVRGLIALMNQTESIGPINIGNPVENTVKELADVVVQQCGVKGAGVEYKPKPSDDPMQRKPDITKAKAILKWEPQWLLKDGLDKTVEYFKENMMTAQGGPANSFNLGLEGAGGGAAKKQKTAK
jgi:UDP-glucuronate decarboxylase